ncbi:hypothetical protein ABFG93_03510 [Pseudalkalibacillus hwajinpoensis]|uniref:hypothetical protein n=1 Tax=Guptibacillus hwajinpoensis TaxID=208199 RepID=UPI00325BD830
MAHTSQHDIESIPKLDLEEFQFSPPGSMGWSYAEYEKIVDSDELELEVNTTSKVSHPDVPKKTLKELPNGLVDNSVESKASEEALSTSQTPSNEAFEEEKLSQAVESDTEMEEHQQVKQSKFYSLNVKTINKPLQLFNENFKPYNSAAQTVPKRQKEIDEATEKPELKEETTDPQELALDQKIESENGPITISEPKTEDDALDEIIKEDKELKFNVYHMKSEGSSSPPWLAMDVRNKNTSKKFVSSALYNFQSKS